jgi:hypothetical protein
MRRLISYLALSPLALAAVMSLVTPTYFRPMFENFIGLLMLAVVGVLSAAGLVLATWGLADVGAQRQRRGWVKVAVGLAGFALPALIIVIIGPAALILMMPS